MLGTICCCTARSESAAQWKETMGLQNKQLQKKQISKTHENINNKKWIFIMCTSCIFLSLLRNSPTQVNK